MYLCDHLYEVSPQGDGVETQPEKMGTGKSALSLCVGITAIMFLVSALCYGSTTATVRLATEQSEGNHLVALRCGLLINGLLDEPLVDQLITIQAGRIISLESFSNVRGEVAKSSVMDLSALTCLPGLINTHVHFDTSPEDAADYGIYARRTSQQNLRLILDNARTTLLTGFTTVRHVGAWFPDAVYRARELIDQGQFMGPRILTAGPYLTIPGGGGDLTVPQIPPGQIPQESQQGIASTPAGFATRAEAAILAGADFLKVIASGAVFSIGTEPGAPEMTREDIEAVVKVARQYGKQVTAHVHGDQSGRDAILAGVNSLEHASLLEDDTIFLARDHGVALSMDVYNGTYTDTVGRHRGYPAVFLERNKATTEAQRIVFEKAYQAGVTLLYGTDAGVLPHDMGGWQFTTMVERGMSPMDAIRSATSVAAEHLGLDSDVGVISSGKVADLIAVRGNPLENTNALRAVEVVIKNGLFIKTSNAGPQ